MDPKILTCFILKLHELLQRILEFPKNVASFECNLCHLVTPIMFPNGSPLGEVPPPTVSLGSCSSAHGMLTTQVPGILPLQPGE